MRKHLCLIAVLLAAFIGASCDENLSTLAGPSPNLTPTFASIQRDIFQSTDAAGRTACVVCHTSVGRTPAGGYSVDPAVAYDQLVNVPTPRKPGAIRVIPGDPENSYLIQKLEGRADIVGRRMPFNGPPYLTDGQMLIIKRWIEVGAPRN